MKKIIIALTFTILSMSAQAGLITVDGTDYDVTMNYGTFAQINAGGTLESQIWFGDSSLAIDFAQAVGNMFGWPNQFSDGIWFVYELNNTDFISHSLVNNSTRTWTHWRDPTEATARYFATASIVDAQVPEPSTLAIFALGIIGLASRRSLLVNKKTVS